MAGPLISVLLPVYNGEPYLAIALDSILQQDYRTLEIIGIDDGSIDRSLEILERYRKADPRISIISRENRGLIASLNEGLIFASGDLVARMDADDIAYPTRLSRQVAAFAAEPDLAICGSRVDTLLGDRLLRSDPNPVYQQCSLRVLSMFFTLFLHSTVVYNRRALPDGMLTYDPSYPHAEDFDLFRRIVGTYSARMIDESLIAYRMHGESVTNKHTRQMRRTHLKIVAENLARDGLIDDAPAIRAIGEEVTFETVQRAGVYMVELEQRISALPDDKRPSYEEGALCFFHFLYQMIGDEQRPALTHEFLTRTARWRSIRRRERYGLRVGLQAPWLSRAALAVADRTDAVARYLKSMPVKTVLPASQV